MWIQYTCVQYIENRTIPVCGVSRTSQLWIIGLNVFFFEKANSTRFRSWKKIWFYWLSVNGRLTVYRLVQKFILPKKNLMQRILYCHHENTPQWKFFIAMSHVISDQLGAKIIWCNLYFLYFTIVVAKHGTLSFM